MAQSRQSRPQRNLCLRTQRRDAEAITGAARFTRISGNASITQFNARTLERKQIVRALHADQAQRTVNIFVRLDRMRADRAADPDIKTINARQALERRRGLCVQRDGTAPSNQRAQTCACRPTINRGSREDVRFSFL